MNNSEQDPRLAVSLERTDQERWNADIAQLRAGDRLLGAAIDINKLSVAIAAPLSYIFRIIGLPLWLLGLVTARLVHLFFRLLITPIFGIVLLTSSLWDSSPRYRPFLIIVVPIFVMLSLWLLALFPEQPDIREAKIELCKLWPLSSRRLEWIRTYRFY